MKKILYLLLVVIMLSALVLVSCGEKSDDGGSNGNGEDVNFPDVDTKEALTAIWDKSDANKPEGTFLTQGPPFVDAISNEKCQDLLGLTPAQFDEYVTDAYSAQAAIGTHAFLVALVKCNDGKAAAEVKKLIASGFNHGRWVCAIPEQCFVVEAGNFVFFGAVYDNVAETLQDSFNEQFEGKAGTVNKFYERGDDVPEGDGGLGGGLILG